MRSSNSLNVGINKQQLMWPLFPGNFRQQHHNNNVRRAIGEFHF